MTTGKTKALTRQTFAGKVMSLLFTKLSLLFTKLVITFHPRSKRLLISWLQSPSVVILETPPKIKSFTVSIVSPSICHDVMGLNAMILDLLWFTDGTGCHDLRFSALYIKFLLPIHLMYNSLYLLIPYP